MTDPIAKCGCDCSQCPSYKNNLRTLEDRNHCSAGWQRCFGIRLSPEKLRTCDGCSVPDHEREVYYLNCRVRKCAQTNYMDNCACCSIYPCDDLLQIHSAQGIRSRQDFEDQTGRELSEAEYHRFVEPYCGISHLDLIRQSLPPEAIKKFKDHSLKFRFAPESHLKDQPEGIRILYGWLTTICVEEQIPFARLQTLRKQREQILRILWTAGLYGNHTGSGTLELDSKTFLSQKITGNFKLLAQYLEVLKPYDIFCEFVPHSRKKWLTPTGWLRKEGWRFRFTYDQPIHAENTIKTVQATTRSLLEKYGSRGFQKFKRAEVHDEGCLFPGHTS